MTGKGILEALSFVEDKYIDEAEVGSIPKRRILPRMLPLVACLCLVVFALRSIPQQTENVQQMENAAAQETLAEMLDVEAETEMNKEPDQAVEEVPGLILRIESWVGLQFTATVAQLVDTDVIPVGTTLTVIWKTDPTWTEYSIVMDKDISEISLNPGDLVHVQFYQYDPATNTIWVDWLEPWKEEKP